MIEAHAATVVPTHYSIDSIAAFDGDVYSAGAGIARVLQQLSHEDPSIPPIAARLMKRPPTELTRNGHASSVVVSDSTRIHRGMDRLLECES